MVNELGWNGDIMLLAGGVWMVKSHEDGFFLNDLKYCYGHEANEKIFWAVMETHLNDFFKL